MTPHDDSHRTAHPSAPGIIFGRTFDVRAVNYSPIAGRAIFEGDIVLGSVAEMERLTNEAYDALSVRALVIRDKKYLWPDNLIPYELTVDLEYPDRVETAIEHWHENTPLQFVRRQQADAERYPNYISFVSLDGCWSNVGMQGGRQEISLVDDYPVGTAIHEIGHAVGLWHEQSRGDRDDYVTIRPENIDPDAMHNFDQQISDGDDIGPYDYSSIMHYPDWAFSVNGKPTIVQLRNGPPIGQRDGLSPGDIAAVKQLYPAT